MSPRNPTSAPKTPTIGPKPLRARGEDLGVPSTPSAYALRAEDGLDRLTDTEWLLTNGLGGFAMGTASGIPTRRYHALLCAALLPPVGRFVALSAMVDSLVVDPDGPVRRDVDLSSFAFKGPPMRPAVVHPRGHALLTSFEHDLSAKWTYEFEASPGQRVRVSKEVVLHERVNAAGMAYRIERLGASASPSPLRLHMRPLAAMRDFHSLRRRPASSDFGVRTSPTGAVVSMGGVELHMLSDSAVFAHEPAWWHDFFYRIEQERGQDCFEDLFSPGYFVLDLPAGERSATCVVQASIGERAFLEIGHTLRRRRERLGDLTTAALAGVGPLAGASERRAVADLVRAADDFVVARASPAAQDPTSKGALSHVSVIAGYPWFGDWGRDTFVSLPGLMLATGRADDALRTLVAFAKARRGGIIPNLFDDRSGHPEYNTADASLWFVHGACSYLAATGDRAGFENDLLPACLEIVGAYRRGTDFNIAMDPMDKLITAGNHSTQLTWMDARRDGVVFTPRHGKPVEINALWHNALKTLADALRPADPAASANLNDLGDSVARSFKRFFWNDATKCLFDCLTPCDDGSWRASAEIRPNQIFAVSLPHSPLDDAQKRGVLACVRDRLLTPMGLRTLDPADPRYRQRYEGSLFERDAAYHNGTAWPWLLGPYAEGLMRTAGFSETSRREALGVLSPIVAEMVAPRGGCLGRIAEIYDGSDPQRPQGCTAQAWSVAEVLRATLLALRA